MNEDACPHCRGIGWLELPYIAPYPKSVAQCIACCGTGSISQTLAGKLAGTFPETFFPEVQYETQEWPRTRRQFEYKIEPYPFCLHTVSGSGMSSDTES